ncbi:hypothetical protein ACWGE0_06225 [Lentzea sp. NPDC054927]
MTGEEEDVQEIVQVHENGTNVVRGEVHGTVIQFDRIDADGVLGEGIVIRARKPKED